MSVVYVDVNAPGPAHNGRSWLHAYTDLQQALTTAAAGETIDVAEGTYRPTEGTDRTVSFQLEDGVAIYGGFAGNTTSTPGVRNVTAYPTILSGDIGQAGNNADNSYHVVYANEVNATAILDGFTITAGNANGTAGYLDDGGGVFCNVATPALANCTLSGNTAADYGGGMFDGQSSPTLFNCVFSENSTQNHSGGGMCNVTDCSPTLTDCSFTSNTGAVSGGGMYNFDQSSPTLSNCTFTGNMSDLGGGNGSGGGVYNENLSAPVLNNCTFTNNSNGGAGGGGIDNNQSSPTLIGCTFTGNTATAAAGTGGAMYDINSSAPTLTNCTFTGNSSVANGGAMTNNGSSPALNGCIFSGNSTSTANGSGGAIFNSNSAGPTLAYCTFAGNSAVGSGGGLGDDSASPMVMNCTFSANSVSGASGEGGGIFNYSSSSPTVTNCVFTANSVVSNGFGGGMCNATNSSPSLTDCTFSGNTSSAGAGGMYNLDGSSPTLIACDFIGNTAGGISGGAGMFNSNSAPTLINCAFRGNMATGGGGGGAGMYNESSAPILTGCDFINNSALDNAPSTNYGGGGLTDYQSAPILTDCTFRGNTASYGGGMYDYNSSSPKLTNCLFVGNSVGSLGGGGMVNSMESSPTLTNCTFTANTATGRTGGITDVTNSTPALINCILWGDVSPSTSEIYAIDSTSTATASYSDIQGGYGGTRNISVNPKFLRKPSPGPDGVWGTADDDYGDLQLPTGSPCVNTGSSAAVPSGVTTDLAGNPRIFGGTVDMGAYEFVGDSASAITSAATATFLVGSLGEMTVTTTGYPIASLIESGSLPGGMTFHDNDNGTATLSGTPAVGTKGTYTLALTAKNGSSPHGRQTFVLTVGKSPAITSTDQTTFTTGQAGSFSLTTKGFPVASLSESGAIPSGLRFIDNGDGTGELLGTPAAGSSGIYILTFTAKNGVKPNAKESIVLVVD